MPDVLSDVLQTVRLRGAIFYVIDAGAPWAASVPGSREMVPRVMPDAEHLIEYHVVTRGSCLGGIQDGQLERLHAGDVIAFPHGDAHVLSSAPDVHRPGGDAAMPPPPPLPPRVRLGGEGEPAQVICGFLGCDAAPFNPLLASLPRMLLVRGGASTRMAPLLELALAETRAPREGTGRVLAGLSELLFIEVVREHVAGLGEGQTGWLAGLRDELVGRALQQIHGRPAHPWTVDSLARAAGSSRSVLSERFSRLVGASPMSYVTSWRMQLARSLLSRGDTKVAAVAAAVGYESEAAFSRAFKRHVGRSPASVRR